MRPTATTRSWFSAVVIDRQTAVGDKALQRRPLIGEVADRIPERRFRQHDARECLALGVDPREQRDGLRLAKRLPRVDLEVGGDPLDLVELLDERHHQGGGSIEHEGFDEPSPRMGPTPNLHDLSALIQRVVADVRIRLQRAAERREKRRRAVPLVSSRRLEHDLLAERIQIGPEPPLETAPVLAEHRDGGVVGLEIGGGRDLAPQLLADRRQRGRDVGDPATQGRAGQVDPFPREHALEPMQRQMIHILRDDDVGEESFARERFLERLRRRRRFHDTRVALRARVFRARGLDHHKIGRLVLEFLGDRFADARLRVAAGAVFLGLCHVDLHASARQVPRQRAPSRRPTPRVPAHGCLARVHLDRLTDRAGFVRELLERELELPRIDALGRLAKQSLTQHVELLPQGRVLALDCGELFLQGGDEGARRGEIVDRRVGRSRLLHSLVYTIRRPHPLTPGARGSRWDDALEPATPSRAREINARE